MLCTVPSSRFPASFSHWLSVWRRISNWLFITPFTTALSLARRIPLWWWITTILVPPLFRSTNYLIYPNLLHASLKPSVKTESVDVASPQLLKFPQRLGRYIWLFLKPHLPLRFIASIYADYLSSHYRQTVRLRLPRFVAPTNITFIFLYCTPHLMTWTFENIGNVNSYIKGL